MKPLARWSTCPPSRNSGRRFRDRSRERARRARRVRSRRPRRPGAGCRPSTSWKPWCGTTSWSAASAGPAASAPPSRLAPAEPHARSSSVFWSSTTEILTDQNDSLPRPPRIGAVIHGRAQMASTARSARRPVCSSRPNAGCSTPTEPTPPSTCTSAHERHRVARAGRGLIRGAAQSQGPDAGRPAGAEDVAADELLLDCERRPTRSVPTSGSIVWGARSSSRTSPRATRSCR